MDVNDRQQEAAAAAKLESLRQSDPVNYPTPPPPEPEPEPQPEPLPDAVFNIPDSMYPEVCSENRPCYPADQGRNAIRMNGGGKRKNTMFSYLCACFHHQD